MKRFQQYSMKLLVLTIGYFYLGVFSPFVLAEEIFTPSEARHRIKEQGIRYREEEFIESVEEGNLELAVLFLRAGKDGNAENFSGESVLMLAAKNGDLEMLKLLLEHGADPNTTGGFYHRSALHMAAEKGFLKIVDTLVKSGAKLNITDKDGNTALLIAAKRNDPMLITLLVERGADVSAKDTTGKSPLADVITKHIEEGNIERVRFFLTAGMSANVKKSFLGTPSVVIAAENDDLAMIKALEMHGADLNAQDNFGKTALMIASANKNLEMIHFLVDRGADASIRDKYGKTTVENFFLTAVKNGEQEIVTKLLKAGSDPNIKNMRGAPALHIAVEFSHAEIVKTLLAFGADVESKDSRGKIAFDKAFDGGDSEIQEILQKALDIKLEKY